MVNALGVANSGGQGGGQNITFGNRFHVAGTWTVSGIRWWRDGSSPFPLELRIYDRSDSSTLIHLGPAALEWAADGASWYVADFVANGHDPVVLTDGHNFVVSYYNEQSGARQATSPSVAPQDGFTSIDGAFQGGNVPDPNTTPGAYYSIDIVVSGGGTPPEPPPTVGGDPAATGDLAAWLSADPDVQAHEATGLPWLTYEALQDATNGLAAIKAAVVAVAGNVTTILGRVPSTLAADMATLISRTATLIADSAELIARVPATIGDSLASLLGFLSGNEGSAVGALSGRTEFPTELWTMADEVEFEWQKSWDVPADLYTLHVEGIPAYVNNHDVDGAMWRPRLGWWALRNGDILSRRQFVDWADAYLEDGGRRMPGVVVRTQPGCTCTLQAWRLT